jgi:hypothetical protein
VPFSRLYDLAMGLSEQIFAKSERLLDRAGRPVDARIGGDPNNGDKPKQASPRPRATHDKAHAGVNPCERRRSGHSRPAKSFETPHPLDIIQVVYFLERR